jgi:integrase
MPRTRRKPAYFRHRPSGQARVRIDGKDHYLGPIDSDNSWTRYDALIEDWARRQTVSHSTLTIDELALRFLAFAKTYYVKGEQETSEVDCIRGALRPLVRHCGPQLAAGFGPLKMKAVRESMIQAGGTRSTINKYVQRIRRLFRWAAENELVPVTVYQAVATVRGLSKGRTAAPETKAVKPVPLKLIEAIRPHVGRQVWGMVQLQLLTAARPGEVVSMRLSDLDTAGPIWEYVPRSHKTEHQEKSRLIWIGPRGQAVLREFLSQALATDLAAEAFLFSPTDAEAEHGRRRRKERKSPMTPSHASRRPKHRAQRRPKDRYTVASYRRAIERACELAFGMPAEFRKLPADLADDEKARRRTLGAEWRRAHCWHPNQLRHSAGTFLRREFGLEAARVILGHAHVETTEIYAEADLQRAREIMGTVG